MGCESDDKANGRRKAYVIWMFSPSVNSSLSLTMCVAAGALLLPA